MGRQWTQQQKNSIYATDGSVLVSAAAGSGKTAVLVERVINLITREENPIDADRLLIVTFTRAAAAEMKERISLALSSLLENDPYNPQLIKQRQLLYNASISTIDSFCGDIVREYFHVLGISRDFRIADDGELTVLSNNALDKSFETFYEKGDDDFVKLLDAFSSKNGDIRLRETVLKIFEFLSTQPFPDVWLDNMQNSYNLGDNDSFADTIWGKIIIDYAQTAVSHTINLTENTLQIIAQDAKLQNAYIERIESDLAFLSGLQKKLLGSSWNEIAEYVLSFSAGRLTAPRGYADNPLKIAASNNRDEVKSVLNNLKKYFAWNEEEAKSELDDLHALVSVLFSLVREYKKEFDSLKLKKNILSFADVEMLTVKLLAEPCGDTYKKTDIAYEISSRFDSVMVDEFQDVNDVQDLIFKCVSNNENNLFVVGDVKQSIYGFRQAKPQIFIDRKNRYNRFDEKNPNYPATIILDKNFRSRREVCDTVNFIFSRLMTKQAAQMDYTSDELLNPGAAYDDMPNCDFEITMIEKSAFEDYDSAEVEARYIARKIRDIMYSDFRVKDGDTYRKATYGDFAVILRSTKNTAMTYVKTLIECGIPAFSERKENSFETQEIKLILNFLRVIDNPTLDIPLLSVMMSPIYGFTPDELAQIRAKKRYINLYNSVIDYSNENIKAQQFLNEINELRKYSYVCSVDELIGKIYEITALGAITSAVKGGGAPLRNLNLLRVYARSFESNGYKTLSDFISYIDKLIENKTQLPASSDDESGLNGVRVLSIHTSKGLEYPICILADTARKFNQTDLKSDVLIDSKAGLGIKRKSGLCRFNTLPRLGVEIEISNNEIAEELRVLYVALTRAKEKLIVVSSQKNIEKYLSNIYSKIVFDKIIEPYAVTGCKSISDWIMLCALVHPSFNSVRTSINPSASLIQSAPDSIDWKFNIIDSQDKILGFESESREEAESVSDIKIQNCNPVDYLSVLQKNINFEYRNSYACSLPQKISASDAAHNDNSGYFEKVLQKPSFLNVESSASVERGTAHHLFLQYCNFSDARNNLDAEINRLTEVNALSYEQSLLIDKTEMKKFLNSQLVTRIINSPEVMREERFTVKINPSMLFKEYENVQTDLSVILQGAVDLAFVEDNKLVIVDYKTDRVRDIQKLADLYSKQLELYKTAMEQSAEMQVKECIICSLHLNEFISLS